MTLRLKRQLMGLVSHLMFLAPLLDTVNSGWMRIGYIGLPKLAVTAILITLVYFFSHTFRFQPSL